MKNYRYGATLLKIEDVSLEYDGRPILRNVNAEIKDIQVEGEVMGQVVGFLGPSGIGKTQLFRIMAGLNQPTSGRIIINGQNRSVRPGEVGVVAQSYPLFAHRTVLSNLILAAKQKEKDGKLAVAKVSQYLADFDLWDRRGLYPAQLSGGQRQRCAIIQQILCSEHFLLMDEPFSGLDVIMLKKTMRLINQIARMDELNTIILITHDVTTACAISDHLWLLGRDTDPLDATKKLPGARIVKSYDLAAEGLAWQEGLITDDRLMKFSAMIKEQFDYL